MKVSNSHWMSRRSNIVRMDDWDKESVDYAKVPKVLKCDFTDTLRLHPKYDYLYYSLFKRSKEGTPFEAIKESEADGARIAKAACSLTRPSSPFNGRLVYSDNAKAQTL